MSELSLVWKSITADIGLSIVLIVPCHLEACIISGAIGKRVRNVEISFSVAHAMLNVLKRH